MPADDSRERPDRAILHMDRNISDLPLLVDSPPSDPDTPLPSRPSTRRWTNRTWREALWEEGPRSLVVGVLYGVAGALNALALAWVHDRVPRTQPLPDILFDILPYWPQASRISELVLFGSQFAGWGVVIWHADRAVLFRRVLAIAGSCYAFRAITIVSTQVPVPSLDTYCSPASNESSLLATFPKAFSELILALGLNLFSPRALCGDLIFSGHTIILVMIWFTVAEYAPRRYQRLLGALQGTLSVGSMLALIVARKHYTLDVVLGYWVTSRSFWAYHSVLGSPDAASGRAWWAPLLSFVERRPASDPRRVS